MQVEVGLERDAVRGRIHAYDRKGNKKQQNDQITVCVRIQNGNLKEDVESANI